MDFHLRIFHLPTKHLEGYFDTTFWTQISSCVYCGCKTKTMQEIWKYLNKPGRTKWKWSVLAVLLLPQPTRENPLWWDSEEARVSQGCSQQSSALKQQGLHIWGCTPGAAHLGLPPGNGHRGWVPEEVIKRQTQSRLNKNHRIFWVRGDPSGSSSAAPGPA